MYQNLGGEKVLGPAIAQPDETNGVLTQYVEAGMFVLEARPAGFNHVSLAPLGLEMGVKEFAAEPQTQGEHVVDGYVIGDDFWPLYQKLGGEEVVGKPLTEVHFNVEKNRYEQYFENLGFYQLVGQATDQSHLLAYGLWKCPEDCRNSSSGYNLIEKMPAVNPPFSEAVDRLGQDFTGFPITEPYIARDNRVEQIFEYVVLYFDLTNPQKVGLRPVAEMLGLVHDPLEAPSNRTGMFFREVKNGLGYNVPNFFLDKWGLDLYGDPISRFSLSRDGNARQCFKNLCLDYSRTGTIQPSPLGYYYKDIYYRPLHKGTPEPTPLPTLEAEQEISLQVWESTPLVSSTEEQEIGVLITNNGEPLANIAPNLVVTTPDGKNLNYQMPPTGPDGQTRLRIPPIEAANTQLIPYQVCITGQSRQKFCFGSSYMIWNVP